MAPLHVARFRLWPDWYWRCRVCRVESLPLVSWQVHSRPAGTRATSRRQPVPARPGALTGALAHCALAAGRVGVEDALEPVGAVSRG